MNNVPKRVLRKYNLEEYNRALELKDLGYGSLRISKSLNINRSVIEGWINQNRMPYYFSQKRIQAINSEENKERLKSFVPISQPKAVKLSAKLRTKALREGHEDLTTDLAYILGVCEGDGHISIPQRRVILSATDLDFVLNFKESLERWSGFSARFKERELKLPEYIKSRKKQFLCYIDSKNAAVLLKGFDQKKIKETSIEIKASFIKGFFDSEGSVTKNGAVLAFNTKEEILVLVKDLLLSLGIKSNIATYKLNNPLTKAKEYKILTISGYENKEGYYQKVGFSIRRKREKLKEYIEKKESWKKKKDQMTISYS